jgi:hypothetical protein
MPIEINEIAIQMKVGEEAGAAAQTDSPDLSCGSALSASERDSIVADCVKRVLRALDMHRER